MITELNQNKEEQKVINCEPIHMNGQSAKTSPKGEMNDINPLIELS